MMQGSISVESEPGKGSSFRILLPVTEGTEAQEVKSAQVVLTGHNKSILLIDDEVSIRSATVAALSRKGFMIDTAVNGKQGLTLFNADPEKYDLIVTDLSMPIMSGKELIKEIRKSGSTIPVILSTGELGIGDKEEYQHIGITGFIQKPWTVSQLIEIILVTIE